MDETLKTILVVAVVSFIVSMLLLHGREEHHCEYYKNHGLSLVPARCIKYFAPK